MKTIFFVDGDNHLAEGLKGLDLLSENDTVLIFYGRGQSESSVRKLCGESKAHIQLLESVRSGKNSIDFQIITELGILIGKGEAEYAYVISQDKGYESAMTALRRRYSDTFKEVALRPSIESCLQAAFLLRPKDKNELARSLEHTYGPERGMVIYRHLKTIFSGAAQQPEEAAPQQPPHDPVKRRRRRAEKTPLLPEEEEPIVILEGLDSANEDEPKPKKRTHRGGRRHRKRS